METGIIFYDKESDSVGETLFLDGNTMVGKYYKPDKTNSILTFSGYGSVVDNNKIWGKKHIIDYLNNLIETYEQQIKENCSTKEEIYQKVSKKIFELTNKNKNLFDEIENIVKHQELSYSENRKKQISCILKAIKRNNKKIKSLKNSTNLLDKKILCLKNKINQKNKLISLIKTM